LLLGTNKGVHYVLDTVSELTQKQFSYQQLKGDVLTEFTLEGMHYNDGSIALNINTINVSWQFSQLFSGHFWLDHLISEGIYFEQLAISESSEETSAITLPEIILPIDIYLQQIQLSNIDLQLSVPIENSASKPPESVIHINDIGLKGQFVEGHVSIQNLVLDMPEIHATLLGDVSLQQDYPLSINNTFQLHIIDPKTQKPIDVALKGTITGDMKQVELQYDTTGILQSSLTIQAQELLADIVWQAELTIPQFQLATVLAEKEFKQQLIKAHLTSHGDLTQADITLNTHLFNKKEGVNKSMARSNIDINAHVIFAQQQIKSTIQWKHLQWPLNGIAAFASETGRFNLQGTLDDYTLGLQFSVSGSDVPSGDWQANATGNLSQIMIHSLEGKTLDGVITLKTQLDWQQGLSWQADLSTQQINPGVFVAQWPGSLDIKMQSSGKMQDETLQVQLILAQLSGQLREQPLAGGGEFEIINQAVTIKQLNLSSGAAKLQADGLIDKKFDLNWSVDVAKLDDLLPNS
jgi:translocation and assembly module TamB